ncbi:MAG: alpha/beta hydrolase [Clostridia bacterium]|nr:alpha/beta hydrolase [Clostridia bacterium]
MPTKRSQGMLGLIRSHKRLMTGISNDIMQIDPPLERVVKMRLNGTTAAAVPDLGMPAMKVYPHTRLFSDAAILHLHGGAYVSGGMLQCRAIISPICAASGVPALTFSYRLAPEFSYPAQIEDALRAYRYLLDQGGYAPNRIVFVGESAGGNLALALAMKLRDEGEPMPAGLALLSPWVDLAQQGDSYRALAQVDATLNADELMDSAIAFAGGKERLTDPAISPLYGNFTGLPPTEIHCGTHEILLSDSESLEKAMIRDHVDAHLIRWEGMCHVFQAFGFEESKASNIQLGAFIQRCLTR